MHSFLLTQRVCDVGAGVLDCATVIHDVDAPVEVDIPDEAQLTGGLHAANGRDFLTVQVVNLDEGGVGGVCGHKPRHHIAEAASQRVDGGVLDHVQIAVLVQRVDGLGVALGVDGGAVEQGVDVKTHADRDNECAGADDDGLAELVLLGGEGQDHALNCRLGDAAAGFQQIAVFCGEQLLAVVDGGVAHQDLIALGVDGAAGRCCMAGGDAG